MSDDVRQTHVVREDKPTAEEHHDAADIGAPLFRSTKGDAAPLAADREIVGPPSKQTVRSERS